MTREVGSSIFSVSDSRGQLKVKTCLSPRDVRYISFQCQRFVPYVDEKISHVFNNAIKGLSHLNMDINPLCSHKEVAAGCGNTRGDLTECRCEPLNRETHPEIRLNFENKVITTILDILSKQPKNAFHLRLAIFCSGRLLGEEILLFRLFDQLKQEGFKGTINLFLIDRCYKGPISASFHDRSLDQSVGGARYLSQFLLEICQCLPPSITIDGSVFDDSKNYIITALADSRYKHDLLIGADIENANYFMGEIGKQASLSSLIKPITLVKSQTNQPLVCQLDSVGNLQNCYKPIDAGKLSKPKQSQGTAAPKQERTPNRSNNTELAIASSALVACVAALLILNLKH